MQSRTFRNVNDPIKIDEILDSVENDIKII